jgi:large subunit ribosomal protein L54
LIEPRKTLTELEKEVEAAKLTGKYDVMDIEDVKRLVKLRRRAKIKASNAERAK